MILLLWKNIDFSVKAIVIDTPSIGQVFTFENSLPVIFIQSQEDAEQDGRIVWKFENEPAEENGTIRWGDGVLKQFRNLDEISEMLRAVFIELAHSHTLLLHGKDAQNPLNIYFGFTEMMHCLYSGLTNLASRDPKYNNTSMDAKGTAYLKNYIGHVAYNYTLNTVHANVHDQHIAVNSGTQGVFVSPTQSYPSPDMNFPHPSSSTYGATRYTQSPPPTPPDSYPRARSPHPSSSPPSDSHYFDDYRPANASSPNSIDPPIKASHELRQIGLPPGIAHESRAASHLPSERIGSRQRQRYDHLPFSM